MDNLHLPLNVFGWWTPERSHGNTMRKSIPMIALLTERQVLTNLSPNTPPNHSKSDKSKVWHRAQLWHLLAIYFSPQLLAFKEFLCSFLIFEHIVTLFKPVICSHLGEFICNLKEIMIQIFITMVILT